MNDVLPLVAGGWGVLMGLAPLLQIRTILRRRSSADVSIASMSVLLVGFVLWLAYGLSIGDGALIATNVTALTVTASAIAVTLAFRSPPFSARKSPISRHFRAENEWSGERRQ